MISAAKPWTSRSGHGRADYWRVAAGMVGRAPVLGTGAGSFERYWTQERSAPHNARDAHNLYLEALAELGPAGLTLLLVALGAPLTGLGRSRHAPLGPAAPRVQLRGDHDIEAGAEIARTESSRPRRSARGGSRRRTPPASDAARPGPADGTPAQVSASPARVGPLRAAPAGRSNVAACHPRPRTGAFGRGGMDERMFQVGAMERPVVGERAGPAGEDPSALSDPRALQILSTEHWSLLTARSLVYN